MLCPLLCALALACAGGADIGNPSGSAGGRPALAGMVARLGEDLGRWEAFGFSGAVLVARADRVLLSRGYGEADRRTGSRVTPETLFDIGSLSKQLTAAAVLALAEERRLDLHTSIARWLAGVPEDKGPITLHHLLTHTAGIEDGVDDGTDRSRAEIVRQILAEPLAAAPGAEYAYSNDGYLLLAAIVEELSGEPFERYLERRLFAPASLGRTAASWNPRVPDTHLAFGYGGYRASLGGEDPRTRGATWRARGSGGVLSSVVDLLRWYRALRSGRLLTAGSVEAMFTPHTTAEADFLSYGYGWRMQATADGERMVWHSGLDEAYSSMFRHYVDEDVVVIFLSNLSIGGVPMREVLVPPSRSGPPLTELFAPGVAAAPAYVEDAARLAAYRGAYRVGRTGRLRAGVEGSALVLSAEGQEAIDALFPPADDAVSAAYAEASGEAERLARCLADGACPSEELDRIDPLGYAARGGAKITEDWRRHAATLGALRRIRSLGTTGLRGRNPDQRVTHLRLDFAQGAVDEHVVGFADDEIYWIPGRPSTLSLRFKPAPGGGLVGFDLLTGGVYAAELSADGGTLTLTGGGRTTHAARIDRADQAAEKKVSLQRNVLAGTA